MQRLRGWLGRSGSRRADPAMPGKIAWRPTLLAAAAAIVSLAIYEALKHLAR